MGEEDKQKRPPIYAGLILINLIADGDQYVTAMILEGDDQDYIAYALEKFEAFMRKLPGIYVLTAELEIGYNHDIRDLREMIAEGKIQSLIELDFLEQLEDVANLEDLENSGYFKNMFDLILLPVNMPDIGKPDGTKH